MWRRGRGGRRQSERVCWGGEENPTLEDRLLQVRLGARVSNYREGWKWQGRYEISYLCLFCTENEDLSTPRTIFTFCCVREDGELHSHSPSSPHGAVLPLARRYVRPRQPWPSGVPPSRRRHGRQTQPQRKHKHPLKSLLFCQKLTPVRLPLIFLSCPIQTTRWEIWKILLSLIFLPPQSPSHCLWGWLWTAVPGLKGPTLVRPCPQSFGCKYSLKPMLARTDDVRFLCALPSCSFCLPKCHILLSFTSFFFL